MSLTETLHVQAALQAERLRADSFRDQLAQATAEVAALKDALETIAEHYTDTALAAKHMSAHARMMLSGTGRSVDYVWRKDRITPNACQCQDDAGKPLNQCQECPR